MAHRADHLASPLIFRYRVRIACLNHIRYSIAVMFVLLRGITTLCIKSHTDGQRLTNGQWFKECRRFTQRDIQPYGKCGFKQERASLTERIIPQERATAPERTMKGDRARQHQRTMDRERAQVFESTKAVDRAKFIERTKIHARAKRRDRAMNPERANKG